MKQVFLKARDEYKLDVHVFAVREAKAVVQIIHGMEEHQERYEPFVKFLNENGYTVVSSDMRGHGRSAKDTGFFKNKKGYAELIEDQRRITCFIKKHFPDVPIYIFAHSMGTIITRVLLQGNSKFYQKVVLSGYPGYQKGVYLAALLAGAVKLTRGAKYKSSFLNAISIGSFNRSVKDAKTESDWICHNEETVNAYLLDPYCGFGFTCSAFCDLFQLVIRMHEVKHYRSVNEELELLFLRGKDDPCVGGDKGAEDSRNVLYKAGFHKIKFIDYPDMRHEILAEKEHQKVYEDVLDFYKGK